MKLAKKEESRGRSFRVAFDTARKSGKSGLNRCCAAAEALKCRNGRDVGRKVGICRRAVGRARSGWISVLDSVGWIGFPALGNPTSSAGITMLSFRLRVSSRFHRSRLQQHGLGPLNKPWRAHAEWVRLPSSMQVGPVTHSVNLPISIIQRPARTIVRCL
jgi:hypothetical protein